jgi:hypothetical protein
LLDSSSIIVIFGFCPAFQQGLSMRGFNIVPP